MAPPWIDTSPDTLKTFVANRVPKIQTKTGAAAWRHVQTEDNAVNLISRNQYLDEFLQPSIWQHGPEWLRKREFLRPMQKIILCGVFPQQKAAICLTSLNLDITLLERFSSWEKKQRVFARCLWRRKANTEKVNLTAAELREAYDKIIQFLQRVHFARESQCLSKTTPTSEECRSIKLHS